MKRIVLIHNGYPFRLIRYPIFAEPFFLALFMSIAYGFESGHGQAGNGTNETRLGCEFARVKRSSRVILPCFGEKMSEM